jgi:hypothetical protein
MLKGALGVIAGLVAWLVVVSVLGYLMRVSWPAYASVAAAMTFTVSMMIARLSIGAVATIAGGFVTAAIAPSAVATFVTGGLLLAGFIPVHVSIWQTFPVWYHLTFLGSLLPLTWLGGRMKARAS